MTEFDGRGILYPARLPTFHREPAPVELAQFVRWFWIPQWDLAAGRSSRQDVLPFPASNLTVQPDGITLSGPSTRATHRDLQGRGWAVGALLRPAALPQLGIEPHPVRNREIEYRANELLDSVAAAMGAAQDVDRRAGAVAAYGDWLSERLDPPDAEARLANQLEDVVASDRSIVRIEHLAQVLGMSVRSVQRLAQRYIGLPPLAVIRRYRLQEAAQRLRENPDVTVGLIAAELGYADQAHLCADFTTVLGFNPSVYRRRASPASGSPDSELPADSG